MSWVADGVRALEGDRVEQQHRREVNVLDIDPVDAGFASLAAREAGHKSIVSHDEPVVPVAEAGLGGGFAVQHGLYSELVRLER